MTASDATMLDAVIPRRTVGPLTEEHHAVLLWVHTGTATVEAAGSTLTIGAGHAAWIPPGVTHTVRAEEDSVVFPYLLPTAGLPSLLFEVHVIVIPPGWEHWMIYRWDDNSYTRETIPGRETLLRLVAESAASGHTAPSISALTLPRSPEAVSVARALLLHPGSPHDVVSFASRQNISVKTLQRQFFRETGLSFSAWRTRARIAIAAHLLEEGRAVGWTRQRVGYATPSGFTKAFRRHATMTPREYRLRARRPPTETTIPTGSVRGIVEWSSTSMAPRHVPARSSWTRINGRHELMWVYSGDVRLSIGAHAFALRRGQAMWVPAGLPHSARFSTGSVMLTIGAAYGRVRVGVDGLRVFTLPPNAEALLLSRTVGEYSALDAEGGHDPVVERLFHEQFVLESPDASDLRGVLGDIASTLRRDASDPRSLGEWAAQLGTSRTKLSREFTAQAGESFPRWRAKIRMDVARELLRLGAPPARVSRHVGYRSAAAFTGAFTAGHGMSPREYVRRETP